MVDEYMLLLEHREAALARLDEFHQAVGAVPPERGDQAGPLLDKPTLRSRFHDLVAPDVGTQPIWWKKTSGTSGAPVHIPYSAEFYLDFKYSVFHKAWWLKFGRALGQDFYLALVLTDLADEAGSLAIDPLYSNGIIARLPVDIVRENELVRALEVLARVRPNILSTKPSVLAALVSAGAAPLARPGLMIVGGAALSAGLRRDAEQAFAAPALSLYATSELGVVASECSHGQLHVFAHEVMVRDDHPQAEGEIVVSNGNNRALPLANYRTGDRGRLSHAPCACGIAWPTITSLDGRVVPLFRFHAGGVLSPTRFNRFLDLFREIEEFQVELRGGRELLVRVQSSTQLMPAQIEKMRAFFVAEVPSDALVTIEAVRFPPHEKFARFRVVE